MRLFRLMRMSLLLYNFEDVITSYPEVTFTTTNKCYPAHFESYKMTKLSKNFRTICYERTIPSKICVNGCAGI